MCSNSLATGTIGQGYTPAMRGHGNAGGRWAARALVSVG